METDLERVTALWDGTARERAVQPIQGWLDSALVLEQYVQPRITGSPHLNWLIGLSERLKIPKGGSWLSLGCGAADQEIAAAKAGLFASLIALDASPVSLERGSQKAADEGVSELEFREVDFNNLDLPTSAYDVVLMNMSLHHVLEVDLVLSQVHRALKPKGLFIINEFIGPRQFQFTDLQLGIVRELLAAIPPRLRRDSVTGAIKSEYVRMPVEHWNQADPSEAIRSDRIVPEIMRLFHVVARVDYGGTILNLLLQRIVHNFDPNSEGDVAVLKVLTTAEDVLIRHRVLQSDFTVMVMRRKLLALRPIWFQLKRRFSRILAASRRESANADFRRQAHSRQVRKGFYHWEGTGRWMGRRGELELLMNSKRMSFVLAAPMGELRQRHPAWQALEVRVHLEETTSGLSADLDPISVVGAQPVQYIRWVPESFFSAARERVIRLTLACDNVWIPAETLASSDDVRSLTVQLLQAGFENGP